MPPNSPLSYFPRSVYDRRVSRRTSRFFQTSVRANCSRGRAPGWAPCAETALRLREHLDEDARIRTALDLMAGLADQRACLVVPTEVVPYLGVREQRVADLGLGDPPPREFDGAPDLTVGLVELAPLLERLAAGDVGHRVRPVIVETALAPELDGGTGQLGRRVPVTALGMIRGEAAVRVDDREVVAGRPGAPNSLLERGDRLGWLAAPEQGDTEHRAADGTPR